MIAESTPMTAEHSTGTSQLRVDAGADFTSANTSPGTAKTLSKRAASDIRDARESLDCISGKGGGCSISKLTIGSRR